MRNINKIFFHCTQTPRGYSLDSVLNYWIKVKKWRSKGYHYIVLENGEVVNLEPIENLSNGAKGYNSNSIHIAYMGGSTDGQDWVDTRTDAQKRSLERLAKEAKQAFPKAEIMGHYEVNKYKECPVFNPKEEYKNI